MTEISLEDQILKAGYGYAYTHPLETVYGAEVVNDIVNESMPPSTPVGSGINILRELYNSILK